MSVISLRLPESLHDRARDVARKENISINQLIALALAEKLSALQAEEYLEQRARRGSRVAFERAMSKVPDVEPMTADTLREDRVVYDAGREDPAFEAIWQRIAAHQGETFRQKRGGEFRYVVRGNYLRPDRTNQNISRAHFAGAFGMTPLPDVACLQHLRGPSYIYAILMDDRIRGSDW
jgi:hypothetical protein